MDEIEGVLLDIDGVLAVSWEPLPGAIDTIGWLRSHGVPFRLITNTTTKTRAELARTLRDAGFDVRDDELITAVAATAQYLRANHPNARCFLLSDGDADAEPIGWPVELLLGHRFVIVIETSVELKAPSNGDRLRPGEPRPAA